MRPSPDAARPSEPADGASIGETDLHTGLTATAAAARQSQYGPNALQEKHESAALKLLRYFWGPIPWMIEVAAVLSALVRHWADFAIIAAMLFINALVGFWQEHKADTAIALLRQRLALRARVLRDGTWAEFPAAELVPGDIIHVRLGDILPADVRLREGDSLSVDQSALTGESLPVDKKLGDAAYSGSIARSGEMSAQVTATGMHTFFGKTAGLVEKAGAVSHFQRAVMRIGDFLIAVTLVLVAVILVAAFIRKEPMVEALLFALILTVAAIPVALPAVLSVTLAVGAERLARMKAIVSRLVSIEELAGVDVLCSDKTGTLTQNRLTLGEPAVFGDAQSADAITAAALTCAPGSDDAIDQAIVKAVPDAAARARFQVVKLRPFDPVHKRATAEVTEGEHHFQVAKGAPQVILELVEPSPELRAQVEKRVDDLAAQGYRTLGVARTDASGHWRLLALLPLFDPPRADSASTIDAARGMGVTVKMVTGDHLAIAKQIARRLHLGDRIRVAAQVVGTGEASIEAVEQADGFAQVFPEHKFKIVKALQAAGHIVGMTGDGVNDAPALKQADVGIAVSGATDAARAAAALVLTGEGLSVITQAIEEARRIFERMTAYATYRIAETIRLLLFMMLSILVFRFYPVTAAMIVLLALLNDIPIMMIAYDNAAVAPRPVRWQMPRVLTVASVLGLLGVVASFGLFWFVVRVMHLPRDTVQTLIFLKLLVAGHLTIYLTRNTGPIWQRPFPSWKLIATTECTQVLGTLAAVYGWFVNPIGWKLALLVWAYALTWFFINSGAKMLTYRVLAGWQAQRTRGTPGLPMAPRPAPLRA
ncbi:MAG: plasma-membrane proton-efflux P-type ATPase [Deltaproteobacteria bacterium]|nr:plasma-membrane proton-efflux P-type ATPase [Deltaproteobacteria bacterium]